MHTAKRVGVLGGGALTCTATHNDTHTLEGGTGCIIMPASPRHMGTIIEGGEGVMTTCPG